VLYIYFNITTKINKVSHAGTKGNQINATFSFFWGKNAILYTGMTLVIYLRTQ